MKIAQTEVLQLNVPVDNMFFDINNKARGRKHHLYTQIKYHYLTTLNYVHDNNGEIENEKLFFKWKFPECEGNIAGNRIVIQLSNISVN